MYQKIYTVGCFDFFHQGHINLLESMRNYGQKIIVGIHDDDSIRKLKNLTPEQHKPLIERIKDVKPYCDRVFIISGTDPSPFLEAYFNNEDNFETSLFIRANDNINFPGIEVVKSKMNIQYLPYTQGISSTQIRKNL